MNYEKLLADKNALILDQYSALLLGIYDGPVTEQGWRRCLRDLCTHCSSNSATLILHPPEENNPGVLISWGLPTPDDMPSPYAREFFTMDPFVNLPPDTPTTLAEMVDENTLLESTFYQLCLEPQDIFHIIGIDIYTDSGVRANLRLMRPKHKEAYGELEHGFFSRLLPHIKRAIDIGHRQAESETELALYSGAVAQLEVGTLVVDELGKVIKSNAISDSILRAGDGLRLQSKRLVLADRRQNETLKALLQAMKVQPENHQDIARAFRIPRSRSDSPLGLIVRPTPIQTWLADSQVPVAMIFLRDPEMETSTPEGILRELFDLTKMEARVSMLLANGLTLDEIGVSLNISRNTVRTHLRAVFPKTGVHHQNMLVKLIWRSVAQLGAAITTD
ncbi:helix-turn-helix transcriptional regulator [Halieaceae bacterium]|nr:helix-turn-helix transcriptional regulator [Halieaceae bacterium]